MNTIRIYETDSHARQLQARVLSCEEGENGWLVELDRTIFYPTGGGQPCDMGTLGGADVTETLLRGETVLHRCTAALPAGADVTGEIDWARRLDLMQQHSGEHLVSGLIHARFGYENVVSHSVRGCKLISAPLRPNFWRASTDNDWRGWRVGKIAGCWKEAPERLQTVSVRIDESAGSVTVEKAIPDSVRLTLTYTLDGAGALAVDYKLDISDRMPEPLRVGLQTCVPNTLERIAYFGKGPQENYSDRCEGAFLGLYRSTPEKFMHSYITPQENGNRCDVRWLSLTASDGRGVQFVGAEPLSVSVWNCTQESLDKARHSNEVEPLADALTVNIDRTQTGVGGTDTWSLKARPSDQYRLLEKHYACRFTIIPCNGEAETIRNGRSLFRNQ